MKKKEIKKLSKDEIMKNIDKSKKDLFNFRFQKINSQITNPAKISAVPAKEKATGNPASKTMQITPNIKRGINSTMVPDS